MRPYYALGLLVAGIVLIYLFIQNVEPFIQVPKLNKKNVVLNAPADSKLVSIYLKKSNNKLEFVKSSDSSFNKDNVKVNNGVCNIRINNKRLYDYAIYSYRSNADCTKCIDSDSKCKFKLEYTKDKNNNCYALVLSDSVTVHINNNQSKSMLVVNTLKESGRPIVAELKNNKLPKLINSSLEIKGLLSGDFNTKLPINDSNNNGATICIDLSIQK